MSSSQTRLTDHMPDVETEESTDTNADTETDTTTDTEEVTTTDDSSETRCEENTDITADPDADRRIEMDHVDDDALIDPTELPRELRVITTKSTKTLTPENLYSLIVWAMENGYNDDLEGGVAKKTMWEVTVVGKTAIRKRVNALEERGRITPARGCCPKSGRVRESWLPTNAVEEWPPDEPS